MRTIESNEPELIAEYSRLYKLMTDNDIDGFIGSASGQDTLKVFVNIDDKFHMVKFEDTPIIGNHPWSVVDVNPLISVDITGGKGGSYSMRINHAVNVLRMHNKWRRGDDKIEPTDPIELGNAIDTVVNYMEDNI